MLWLRHSTQPQLSYTRQVVVGDPNDRSLWGHQLTARTWVMGLISKRLDGSGNTL